MARTSLWKFGTIISGLATTGAEVGVGVDGGAGAFVEGGAVGSVFSTAHAQHKEKRKRVVIFMVSLLSSTLSSQTKLL